MGKGSLRRSRDPTTKGRSDTGYKSPHFRHRLHPEWNYKKISDVLGSGSLGPKDLMRGY